MILVPKILAVYWLVCMAVATFSIVKNFDELKRDMSWKCCSYVLFMAGVVYVVLTSPFWIPRVMRGFFKNLRENYEKAMKELQENK